MNIKELITLLKTQGGLDIKGLYESYCSSNSLRVCSFEDFVISYLSRTFGITKYCAKRLASAVYFWDKPRWRDLLVGADGIQTTRYILIKYKHRDFCKFRQNLIKRHFLNLVQVYGDKKIIEEKMNEYIEYPGGECI